MLATSALRPCRFAKDTEGIRAVAKSLDTKCLQSRLNHSRSGTRMPHDWEGSLPKAFTRQGVATPHQGFEVDHIGTIVRE